MTTRRITLLLMALHGIVPAAAWTLGGPLSGFAALAGLHAALVALTLRPGNRLFGPALQRVPHAPEKSVCLTIDDGPCPDTREMLGILEEFQAAATFFLIGSRAESRPEDVREILRRGHGIGNHTQTHPAGRFWAYGPGAQRREIGNCQDALRRIGGVAPGWFRAPAGFRNPYLCPVLREAGLRCAGWQARGFDTSQTDVARIVRRLTRRLLPGAILLIHQGHPHSPALLRELLRTLRDRGWSATLLLPQEGQAAS